MSDTLQGGALSFPAFDLNGDGVFDETDTNASVGERRLSAVNIDPGMVFRYTFRETGVVLRIELIGLERTAESA